ncbi:hypothetical protein ACLB1E_21965 [Escherichia coli]
MQQGKPAVIFPATERILFAEHYQGPYQPKNDGYAKERELKQHVMSPLISYFRDARESLGITSKQIAEATGKKNMVSHWFGARQWQLPTKPISQQIAGVVCACLQQKNISAVNWSSHTTSWSAHTVN